jgi:3-phenylpropionate/trans-cinnamate dioxygenase ferredoxin subunit
MQMAWQRVAAVADVKPDNPVPVTLGDKQLAIYKLDDSFYCLDDVCPHAYALMSSGFVDGDRIECPLHQAAFEIRTGKCVAPPAESDLATYPVKVEGNDIFIDV